MSKITFNNMKKQDVFGAVFIISIALMPVISFCAPRFLAFWPALIGVISYLSYYPVFGRFPQIPKKIPLWCLSIVFLAALSALWAIDPSFALKRSLKIFVIMLGSLGFIGVALSIPIKNIKPYLKYVLYAVIGMCLLIGAEMNTEFPYYRLLKGMDSYDVVNRSVHNRASVALIAVLFLTIGIASYFKDKKAVLALFVAGAFMAIFNESQSAQLGYLLGLIVFFFFPYSKKQAWSVFTILLCMGTFLAPFIAIWLWGYAEIMNHMPFIGIGNGFAGERLEIWGAVGEYILKSPFYGFGIEATRMIQDFDMDMIYRVSITALHPHNFALQLWIEFGIIGALIASYFFVSISKYLSALNYRQARAGLCSFMGVLCAAAFGYGLWQGWFLGLILFTIAFTCLTVRLCGDEK